MKMLWTPPFGQLSLVLGCALLAGCAGDSDRYPSLAVRDAERVVGQMTPAEPNAPPTNYTTDPARIGGALELARSAHDAFEAEEPLALSLAQNVASDPGDEDARSRALVAVASLSSLRGQTVQAMAELDRLEAEAATTYAPLDDIHRAQHAVGFLLTNQDSALSQLTALLDQ